MPKWYERANEASFKATSGGYVFQAPSPWMLARPRYYLVNETQKAQLLVCLGRWRLRLLITTLINVSLSLAITLPMMLWPAIFVRPIMPLFRQLGSGPFMLLTFVLVALVMAPLLALPQIYLARALRSALAEAPLTEERIKMSEQLPKIAASVSGKVLIAGLIGGLGMMSGGILQMLDAYLDGHLARSALPNAVTLLAGAFLTAYFVYLVRLRAKQKRAIVA